MNQIQRWSSVVTLAVLAGCGGGGGGGEAEVGPAPAPAPGATGDPAPPPGPAPAPTAALPSVSATLVAGDYFQYLATEKSSSSSAAGNSATNESGFVRISLGAPATVAGVDGFAVTVSADAEIADVAPKWTFLAVHGGKWQASTDNVTLVTLYDPASTTGSSGFFIDVPASRAIKVSSSSFQGDYNVFTALALSDAAADGGCSVVLGMTACSDKATSFAQAEYLLDGVGPVGFSRSSSLAFGGTTPGFASSSTKLELVGTSLKPASGVTFKAPPWTNTAALPVPRAGATAAAIGGKIYVYGGNSTAAGFSASQVDVYDPATDQWSVAPAAPFSLDGWRGTGVGTRAALFKSGEGYLHDPATGVWTALPARSDTQAVLSVSPWTHGDGSTDAVVVTYGADTQTYRVLQMAVASQTWSLLATLPATDGRNFGTASVGDKLYFLGGTAPGVGAVGNVGKVTELDLVAKTTRSLPNVAVAGDSSVVTAIGSSVYLLGGKIGVLTAQADVLDTAASTLSKLPDFRHARYEAAVAVVAGKIYLLGGMNDTTTLSSGEVYTP